MPFYLMSDYVGAESHTIKRDAQNIKNKFKRNKNAIKRLKY